MHAIPGAENFWSGTYRGHTIAILNHRGRWLVYLDHAMQHNMLFDTADAAVAWLQHRIDRTGVRTGRAVLEGAFPRRPTLSAA